MTRIAVIGATGRMGSRIVALASEHACDVVASISRSAPQLQGAPQVLADFSTPQATRQWLTAAREQRIPMVIGTTGLNADDHRAIDAAAREIPVLQASNMSLGVALLTALARQCARGMPDCDIEIIEAHHRGKKDAPSGTALSLADAISGGRDMPIHSLRIGDEVGRHTVIFAQAGERIELAHAATTRDTFARGALRAAVWLAQGQPGRYSMSDVFGV